MGIENTAFCTTQVGTGDGEEGYTGNTQCSYIIYNNNNNNNSNIGNINSNDKIAETLYSLGTWFVSGIFV